MSQKRSWPRLLICLTLYLQLHLSHQAFAEPLLMKTNKCPWKTYSDLLIQHENELIGKGDTLTKTQMTADLDCLSQIYQYQYIGSYYPMKHDLSETIQRLKQKIPASMSVSRFMRLIIQSHIPIYDNHFSVAYKTKQDSYYQGMPQYQLYRLKPYFYKKNNQTEFFVTRHKDQESMKACDGFVPYPTLIDGQFIFIKLSVDPLKSAWCKTKNNKKVLIKIEKITANDDKLSDQFEYHTENDFLYIRIPYAGMGQSETEKKLLSTLAKNTFQKNLMIDLRDNHGGSSLFGSMLLASLTKETDKISFPKTISVDSVYNTAALINMYRLISFKSNEALIKKLLKQYEQRLIGQYHLLSIQNNKPVQFLKESSASSILPWPTHGMRKTPYHGKITLLVNRACASSCEDLVSDLKKLKNTTLVGTHTGGFFNYNDVGTLVLPESKIQIHTTTSTNIGPQEISDGIGFAPDFYDIDDHQLERIIHYLRKHHINE